MSIENNKAIARRYNEEVWGKGNLTLIDELVADDFFQQGSGSFGTPDGVRESVSAYHANNSDVSIIVVDQIAEGDKVVNRCSSQAIDNATGKKVAVDIFFDEFHIVDGKIVKVWHAHDHAAVLEQLEA